MRSARIIRRERSPDCAHAPSGPRIPEFVMPGLDTASRVYPTCGASYAELGQARVLWHASRKCCTKRMECRVISAFTRVHSPSKTGVNALNDALCPAMTAVVPRLGALLADRELLLADHLGPFAPLRPDVIGELLR